jgi:O-antigen ligase
MPFLSKTDIRILRAVKILLGLCLLAPLLMSSSILFPYTAPKVFIFRILVEIAAVFYFYLALKHPEFRPKKTALNLAVLVFLAVYFLASFLGADFYLSFWGNLERGIGFWGLLHFAVFFLMLTSVFQNQKDWQNLLRVSIGASALVASLAIGQHFFGLGDLLPQVGRVYSTIGNASFLATYLVFNIFFAGYLAFLSFHEVRRNSKLLSVVYCLLLIVNSFALFLTGTRGALLGLLSGFIVFLLLLFFGSFLNKDNKKFNVLRRWSLVFLILIFIFVVLIFSFRHTSFVQNNSILARLTATSLSGATVQSRLILWQSAWQAWQTKPILGFGLENFEVAVAPYLSPKIADYEAFSLDRAHNFIFDYGVTGGGFGFLAYLCLFVAAGFYLTKRARENFYFSSIFGSLLVAYLVQNFFVFDTFISYLMLFFSLAFISNLLTSQVERLGRHETSFSFFKKIIFLFVVFCSLFTVYSFNLKPLLASNLANQILSLPPENFQQATPILNEALALKTFASDEIIYQTTLDYLDKINSAPQLAQKENFYKTASEQLTKIIERSPSQPRNYIALAWLDLYFAQAEPERVFEAIQLAEKIRVLSPTKKDAYMILVAAYALQEGGQQKAAEVVKQAKAVDIEMGEEVGKYWEKLK